MNTQFSRCTDNFTDVAGLAFIDCKMPAALKHNTGGEFYSAKHAVISNAQWVLLDGRSDKKPGRFLIHRHYLRR